MNVFSYYVWTIRALFLLRYVKKGEYNKFLKNCDKFIQKRMNYPMNKRDKRWHDVASWLLTRKADALRYSSGIHEAREVIQQSLTHAELAQDQVSYLRALLVYGMILSAENRKNGLKIIDQVLEATHECRSKSKKQIRAYAFLQKAGSLNAGYGPCLKEAIRLLTDLKASAGLGQAYYLLYEKTGDKEPLEKAKGFFRKAKLDPEKAIQRLEKRMT
jgi:hypothetical protein